MSRLAILTPSVAVLCLALVQPLTAAEVVTLPNGVRAANVSTNPVRASPSSFGDNPTVSKPDQVFSGETPGIGITVGSDNGEPVAKPDIDPSQVTNTRVGRKLLQAPATIPGSLHLTGSGVSAGDKDAGVKANAYGQAHSDGVTDTHVQPHGVSGSASVGGTQYTTEAAANPDCLGGEGSCVYVAQPGRK